MKQALSLLVAFIFLQTHTWAIAGGPFDGGGGSNPTVGTYAGVMVGDIAIGAVPGSGSLGLFTVGVPSTGIGQGAFALFVGNITIVGDVLALGDPDLETIQGVMTGDYAYTLADDTYDATLGGQFNATVTGGGNSRSPQNLGVRINGSARATTLVPTFAGGAVLEATTATFTVIGYKQSNDGGQPADVTSIGQ